MGCAPGISAPSPVPFLARYLEYRISRPRDVLPESRDANIESRLEWILDELLESPTAAAAEDQQQRRTRYAALLTLCHYINDYSPEVEELWWGGKPGWYRGIKQKLKCPRPVAPNQTRQQRCMEQRQMEQRERDGRVALLPAVIVLGLDAIYESAIAAAVKHKHGAQDDSTTTYVGSHQVDLRGESSSFGTSLYAAVKARKPVLVRRVLSSRAWVNGNQCNPVAAAVKNDDMDMLNLLLEPRYSLFPHGPHLLTAIGVAASLWVKFHSSRGC
ncbi:hypothetical protein PG994_008564 [Apiospora phragmitis]|uniref:Uncharacterized protein n=1 Tax=Apiospora phragmitis TaxID=2905665 RepID=A0ABR1UJ61_9PEZI